MTSDELGLDKPGALTRYFAERWLEEPSPKGEQLIAWLLEAALGRNVMYFIEKTQEYVDAWGGGGEVVPASAFDGFAITGDPVEDTIIPHAVLVWTCMNDRPWPEGVYHRWLNSLLAAGSAEAAYLGASLWPAHDLMAEVAYRPAGWLVYRGQLDAAAERLILTEMLKGYDEPMTSLYGSFKYDDVKYSAELSKLYIKRHGFTHPICGLFYPGSLEWDSYLKKYIQEALAAPSWSEGVKGAAMLSYLSLKAYTELKASGQEILNLLEQNLFKLDEKHIDIINFHMDKIEKIDYNLIKDYINYLIILYKKTIKKLGLSSKMFSKYISIGLRTKDILYIGKDFRDIIFNLTLKEKEKVESWLERQTDDSRIKDVSLAISINERIDDSNYLIIKVDEELKTEHAEGKIEDIYGKIKYIDKINLFIDQKRKYFTASLGSCGISNFIDEILKREAKINFSCKFIEDYEQIINCWHPNRQFYPIGDIFFKSNHIGLYLYCEILKGWKLKNFDFRDDTKKEKQINLYLCTKNKIIENLYGQKMENIDIKLNSYLNKIENNNFPHEEARYEFIKELRETIIIYYNEILKQLKNKRNVLTVRKLMLYNKEFFSDLLSDPTLINLLEINNKPQNMIFY